MFGFPYFENDEGVYLSQAWSLLKEGQLAPYTYWYDHAPMGWMITSFWTSITGGLYTFGFSLNTGRVFMLVIHLLSTVLVFKITKKASNSLLAAGIATLLFSLSPLGIYFHRRLLLDNIMIFLVLWAFHLIIKSKYRVHNYVLSAFIFGMAVLTKENAIFFIPAFLYTIYFTAHSDHKRVMAFKWLLIVGYVVSFYFLFALLKSEFFPAGSLLGGELPHVSLLQTLSYQASRDGGSIFHPATSTFWKYVKLWIVQDSLIIASGVVSTLLLLIIGSLKKNPVYLGISLLSIFFWWFLARGGIVIEFYIIPLIPVVAITTACSLTEIINLLNFRVLKLGLFTFLYCLLLGYYINNGGVSKAFPQYNGGHNIYTSKQTSGQLNAVLWIKENIEDDAVIIIDNYSFLDLRYPESKEGKIYSTAHWYWKVNHDVEILDGVLHNSAQNIDYIALTPQMSADLDVGVSPLVSEARNSSTVVERFFTDGWGVEFLATLYPDKVLKRSWESYKTHFIHNNSYVVDPANDTITSEGQSYALLRSVWLNDKTTFDGVWRATKDTLTNDNGTIAWNSSLSPIGSVTINDLGSATDGDTDIALALIFASKKWEQEGYLTDAQRLLDAIWESEVKELDGKYYLVPGPWAKDKDEVIINPSYLSPYAYRIFAQVDKQHPWENLVDSSYEVLEGCTNATYGGNSSNTGLPPNWCALNSDGDFIQNKEAGLSSTEYSYDAVRTMWRIALDYKWYKDVRAKDYLSKSGEFFENEIKTKDKIFTGYTHDGKVFENYESVLGNSFVLANFVVTNETEAPKYYKEKLLGKFYEDFDTKRSYWEDPNNYYTQNWAWFNTALYADMLPNLLEVSNNASK
jgi:endo-1,4-beta-D-glucanase Y